MKKKITICSVVIVVIILAIILAIKIPTLMVDKNVTPNESPTVSENTVELDKPVELTPPNETTEGSSTSTVKNGYVDFVYDSNESNDSYLSSKVSIQGSGTVNNGSKVSIEGSTSTGSSTGNYTQQFWYKEAEAGGDYLYRVDGVNSNGFGFIPSVRYDITCESTGESIIILSAPNNTRMWLQELDASKGDATYWREHYLSHYALGMYASLVEPDVVAYNTPYILGTGLKDWDAVGVYPEQDLTLNPYGKQLICDITVDTLFGEGYYFELAEVETGTFSGHMIIQHGDRVYYLKADSEYQKSLKDICNATVDRCITTY